MKGSISMYKFLIPLMLIFSIIASGCGTATTLPPANTQAPPVITQAPPAKTPVTVPTNTTVPPTATSVPAPTATVVQTADELVIAIPEDVSNYEPFKGQGDMHTPAIFKMMYDNLIERSVDNKLVPGLATSWSWLDDNTLELKLRSGVKFHNGQDFTADDVVYSIDLLRSIPEGAAFQSIESVEIVDPLTIKVHTNKVD